MAPNILTIVSVLCGNESLIRKHKREKSYITILHILIVDTWILQLTINRRIVCVGCEGAEQVRTSASHPVTHTGPRPPLTNQASSPVEEQEGRCVKQQPSVWFCCAAPSLWAQPRRKTKRRVSHLWVNLESFCWDEKRDCFKQKNSFQVMAHLHFPPSLLDLDHWDCEAVWLPEASITGNVSFF